MILNVENLSVTLNNAKILHEINFSVDNEILVIAGESGSGKSTILKAIANLLDKKFKIEGKILFDGKNIANLSDKEHRKLAGSEIGFVFQNSGASFCPIRKIGEQIFESVKFHRYWSKNEFKARAIEIMSKINLKPEVLEEYPFKLSGGMAQRAGILAATILEPKLLLADEPTSALDVLTQNEVINELLKLKIEIILVTHDLKVAKRMADKILILKRGKIVEFGTKTQIFDAPKEIYTKELLKAAGL